MKKILTVMMIMMIAAVSVFATNPAQLAVDYTVSDQFVGSYAFRLNDGEEETTFNMGSNAGKIAANKANDTFYIIDKSFCNMGDQLQYTITFSDPGVWTNKTTSSVTGSDVTFGSLTGISEGNVTATASGRVLTVTYAAATTVDTVTKRDATPKDVGSFKLTWDECIVPVGTYESTMTVTYATI